MRLRKAERTARLLTRRRNALLAVVERWVRGEERDPLVLSRAMDAYVDALPSSRRRRPTPSDPSRILAPEVARRIFGLRRVPPEWPGYLGAKGLGPVAFEESEDERG